MICDNCGKREANVKYSENINGVKRELNLCEKCSHELGIENIDFSMPIDFSSFFASMLEDFQSTDFMPLLGEKEKLKCKNCGFTFDDIINTGNLGCANCYETFEEKLEPIIRKIQGSSNHTGRLGKVTKSKISEMKNNQENKENTSKIDKLKEELKQAIKEERYEDAAKLRDKINEEGSDKK